MLLPMLLVSPLPLSVLHPLLPLLLLLLPLLLLGFLVLPPSPLL